MAGLGRASTTTTSSSTGVAVGLETVTVTSVVEGDGEDGSSGGWGSNGGYVLLGTGGGDPSLGFFDGREGPPGPNAVFFFLLVAYRSDSDVTLMPAKQQ